MDQRAFDLYNDYVHRAMPRCDFMKRLAGIADFRAAPDAAGVAYSLHMYPGAQHGLHNDASAARHAPEAARLAWARTIALFDHSLKA